MGATDKQQHALRDATFYKFSGSIITVPAGQMAEVQEDGSYNGDASTGLVVATPEMAADAIRDFVLRDVVSLYARGERVQQQGWKGLVADIQMTKVIRRR